MKAVHVVPHLDDEAAGPSQSVIRLCEALALEGVTMELHTMAAGRSPLNVDLIVHKEWPILPRFGLSIELIHSLRAASRSAEIIHNHSLWSFPNMVAGLVARPRHAKLVTSPRGTLAPVARARSRLKKCLFKPIQWPAVARADCLHATSIMEYQDVREIGLKHPVAVIPNGIDIPQLENCDSKICNKQFRRLLFLGRIHPIKGIELLLHAWQALQDVHTEWEVVIAGKGQPAYLQSLQELARTLKLERLSFPGPVYGVDKHRLFCTSELFVLPTKTENFGMAIAEAQARAVPVITTRCAPWSGLVARESGWWIDRELDVLAATLDHAMLMDQLHLQEMGRRGRAWMAAEFSWASVGRQMATVYRWLCEGGVQPPCMHL